MTAKGKRGKPASRNNATKKPSGRRGYTKTTCPTCRGSGEYHFRRCGLCRGGGWIWCHK